jgi:hypothetical protein
VRGFKEHPGHCQGQVTGSHSQDGMSCNLNSCANGSGVIVYFVFPAENYSLRTGFATGSNLHLFCLLFWPEPVTQQISLPCLSGLFPEPEHVTLGVYAGGEESHAGHCHLFGKDFSPEAFNLLHCGVNGRHPEIIHDTL